MICMPRPLPFATSKPSGQPDAVVGDHQFAEATVQIGQGDADRAGTAIGEAVLEGVRQHFVDDQAERDGVVQREPSIADIDADRYLTVRPIGALQVVGELAEIRGEIDVVNSLEL